MLVQQRRMVDGSGKRAYSESVQAAADDEPMIRGEVDCLRFRFGERPAPSRLIVARIRAVFINPATRR